MAKRVATQMRPGMGYAAHPQILYVHFSKMFTNMPSLPTGHLLSLDTILTTPPPPPRPASISTGLRDYWHTKRQCQEGQKANNKATSQGKRRHNQTRAPGVDITEHEGKGGG